MARFVNVPEFFSSVYLVDFSPSLCDVARTRFEKLGWKNVHVVCEDARKFRLEDYETDGSGSGAQTPSASSSAVGYFSPRRAQHGGADLVTMSYSLSMIVSFCFFSATPPQFFVLMERQTPVGKFGFL
jgi:betaine lipid synthase